jgi:hypothetical protein
VARVVLAIALAGGVVRAQVPEPALSDAEVEILRDKAPMPQERVIAFMGFLEDRSKAIEKLTTLKRRPGRDEDIHDIMEQFTSIANDLQDNLDEYDKRHKDVRKALPRLLAATERWATVLKTPPENEAYNLSRKLALEAVADIREAATTMVAAQNAWFQAHPPSKEDLKDQETETRRRRRF